MSTPPSSNLPGADDWLKLYQSWSRVSGRAMQMASQFWLKQMQPMLQQDAAPSIDFQTFDPLGLQKTFGAVVQTFINDPERIAALQRAWFDEGLALMQDFTSGGDAVDLVKDKRFSAEAWSKNKLFSFVKNSYLLASKYVFEMVHGIEDIDPRLKAKAEFYTKQFIDALSPSNFAFMNPQVIQATLDSGGTNLLKGMENLLTDLDAGRISMTDYTAFEVGRNVATMPGRVVFENRLFQLIQYNPTTKTVFETPIVFFPPWINKYYILDLTPEKSMVRYLTDQGFTVFMVSWVNPDETLRDIRFEDYMIEGQIAALHAAQQATGVPSFHVVGYCVAGTLLACTLAYLKAKNAQDIVKSATFFTAQVDFQDSGELRVFVDKEQLGLIGDLIKDTGLLDSSYMATSFNLLRSNDLIWSYVVNNYMLGKDPFPFDLLYWNSDNTRMPGAMHLFYLCTMYDENKLVQPGAVVLGGVPIDLSTITTPCYVQAGREDHIAPAQSAYKVMRAIQGPARFLLAGSGHIAGVVNPPAAKKYQYWTNEGAHHTFEEFLQNTTEHPGSWWPDWVAWLVPQSGPHIAARHPPLGIEPAPGRYVRAK